MNSKTSEKFPKISFIVSLYNFAESVGVLYESAATTMEKVGKWE